MSADRRAAITLSAAGAVQIPSRTRTAGGAAGAAALTLALGLVLAVGDAAVPLAARAGDDEEAATLEPMASTVAATTAVTAASTRVPIACSLRSGRASGPVTPWPCSRTARIRSPSGQAPGGYAVLYATASIRVSG